MSDFSKGSFLFGMISAIDQIRTEYEACQFEFEGDNDRLAIIKSAFSRAIGLIEDEMIQYGADIKINELVDKFNEETS